MASVQTMSQLRVHYQMCFALFLHQNASRDYLQDGEITLNLPAEACKHLKSGLNKGLAGTCCVKK